MACIWACNSEWLISLTARRGQSLAGGRLTLPGFKGHVREHVATVKTRGVVGWAVTLLQPTTAEKCLRPWPNLQLSGHCQSSESTLYLITLEQVQTNRFKWKSDLFSVFLLTLARLLHPFLQGSLWAFCKVNRNSNEQVSSAVKTAKRLFRFKFSFFWNSSEIHIVYAEERE